eukprot:Phypoly_transcript_24832.p1 GENE.Phypoly_transcript_24832~~Phypoly_transcript_24832.p1  ORF type:complete len:170 (+),score=24.63 Phypoly_transcript_24832:35-511(+)
MGVSGFVSPSQVLGLFNLPPTTYKHEEIGQFILSFSSLYANLLGVISLAQSFSFLLALLGDNETKRTVCKINAFLNVALVACFWYNIHYINNPSDDFSEHLLFKEQGIASVMFSNMWAIADSAFLIYLAFKFYSVQYLQFCTLIVQPFGRWETKMTST